MCRLIRGVFVFHSFTILEQLVKQQDEKLFY